MPGTPEDASCITEGESSLLLSLFFVAELCSMVWNCMAFDICIFPLLSIAAWRKFGLLLPSARVDFMAFLVCETGFEFRGVMLLSVGVFTSVIIFIWFTFLVGVLNLPGTEPLL